MCGSYLGCLLLPWWFWIELFASLDDNFPVKLIDFAWKNLWVPFESDLLQYCAPWIHPSVPGSLKIQASKVPLLRCPSWVLRRTVAEKTQGVTLIRLFKLWLKSGTSETATGSPLSGPHFGTFSWWSAVSLYTGHQVCTAMNQCHNPKYSIASGDSAPQCVCYTFLFVCPS